jgi:hypothetical protein
MNRKPIIWTVALAATVFLLSAGCLFSPIRHPENQIQSWVLRKAPLGSSVAEVKALIERQGWKLEFDWQGAQKFDYPWQSTNLPPAPREYPYVSGCHVIGADLGGYQGIPFRADVDAFWGFDDKGRLIDFHVRKNYEGL